MQTLHGYGWEGLKKRPRREHEPKATALWLLLIFYHLVSKGGLRCISSLKSCFSNSTLITSFFSLRVPCYILVDEFKFTILNTVALMKTYPGVQKDTLPQVKLTFHSNSKLQQW